MKRKMGGFNHDESTVAKSMLIYKIMNQVDGKVYIGQTVHKLGDRFRGYSNRVNVYLKRAIKKHGTKNFHVSIVEQCSNLRELNEAEERWISHYKSCDARYGYNLSSGGLNHRVHPLTKKILAKKCSGWHHTKEAKEKIGEHSRGEHNWAWGKTFSPEYREKLRKAHLGIRPSLLTRKRLSRAQKKRKITWGDKISATKTLNVDMTGAIDLYKNGYSLKKISNIIGHSVHFVWRRLKKNGVQMRLPSYHLIKGGV